MIDRFRAELIREGFSKNTVEAYTRNARLFTEWVQATTGEPFDNQISVFDGREYRSYLLNVKKLRPNSVNAKLQAVQRFADFLSGQGTQQPVKIKRQKVVASTEVKVLDKAKSDCLPFRMLLRLATICYYTDLSFDEDMLSDDILRLIYEETLFERITGAKEHPSLINMIQYNDMLAEISDKVKQAWDTQNDAWMARWRG